MLIIPEPNKSTQTNPPIYHQNRIWRSQSSPKEVHGKKDTKYTFKITSKSKLYLINVNFFQKISFILRQCFTLVPPHETLLVAKICQLMLFLVRKQAVHFEKPVLDVAIPWFLQAIADSGDLALLDVLQALEAVICYSNNDIKEVSLNNINDC